MNFILLIITAFSITLTATAAEVCKVEVNYGNETNMECTSSAVLIKAGSDEMAVIKTMAENGYDLKTDKERSLGVEMTFVKP